MSVKKGRKFQVRNREHSRQIQEALFALGYNWCRKEQNPQYLDNDNIQAWDDGTITSDPNKGWNYSTGLAEQFKWAKLGDILPQEDATDKPPIGLRPKSVVDKLRILEILEAMQRYVNEGEEVPVSWLRELDDLYAEKNYVV